MVAREQRKKRLASSVPLDRRQAYFRLTELERLFTSRYGSILPDDEAGRGDLFVAFNHIAYRSGDGMRQLLGWGAEMGTVAL